jgi:8-oxo-dGTP diphosphatase
MPEGVTGPLTRIDVAVGVIEDGTGRVLITRRREDAHQGGLWEFPGGKVEPGETVIEALRRELAEELGIGIASSEPLIRVPYDYPDKRVRLDVHRVQPTDQRAVAREGQAMRWVDPAELTGFAFPPANAPIVAAAILPGVYCVSPDTDDPTATDWWSGLAAALAAGRRLFQYRVPSLAEDKRHAGAAVARIHRAGGRCLINADPVLAGEVGADGVHLPSRLLYELTERPALDWVGASCHSPDELARAVELGADFAVLGPVAPTASHPDRDPLGWQRFGLWVADCPLPVYALGGMGSSDIEQARRAGGQGVAGIRGFW